jgi:uncharacterized protein YbjT (DUF2867 family)
MRIVVTGATGTVGGAVLRRLLNSGHGAVAAVRQPDGRDLPDGAEAVPFDFTDASTHRPALDGADGLFLMRPPAVSDTERYVNPVVDAAEAAGVRRIAFLSVLGAGKNPLLPHRATEKRLEASPLDAALLRAANFMQNLAEQHADDVRAGRIAVPAGTGRTSFVDARDVGDVAAAWLARDVPAAGGTEALDLTGPEALDYFEVAATLSDVLGRRVVYTRPGAVGFFLHKQKEGAPIAFAGVMTGIYTATRLGLADRVTDTVERVLGRPARTVRQFAEDYRETWT